ncbi:hypothetical protein [Vibrio phage V-YDF132]|nr:hypothetical protein [Vibrio phage V-YDF132]
MTASKKGSIQQRKAVDEAMQNTPYLILESVLLNSKEASAMSTAIGNFASQATSALNWQNGAIRVSKVVLNSDFEWKEVGYDMEALEITLSHPSEVTPNSELIGMWKLWKASGNLPSILNGILVDTSKKKQLVFRIPVMDKDTHTAIKSSVK